MHPGPGPGILHPLDPCAPWLTRTRHTRPTVTLQKNICLHGNIPHPDSSHYTLFGHNELNMLGLPYTTNLCFLLGYIVTTALVMSHETNSFISLTPPHMPASRSLSGTECQPPQKSHTPRPTQHCVYKKTPACVLGILRFCCRESTSSLSLSSVLPCFSGPGWSRGNQGVSLTYGHAAGGHVIANGLGDTGHYR